MRIHRLALLSLVLPLLLASPAQALEPQRREAVVASMRVWDGDQFKEALLPSSMPEMTLIAGQASAVVFVRTQEYFWPLSRQVYVDFDTQRDVLDGRLRIEKDGVVVAEEPLQSYSVLYPEGAIKGDGRLLWGAEAEAAYVAEQQAQSDFAQRTDEALRARAEYERRLARSASARGEGEPPEEVSPPPPLPEPSLRLVTRPATGFRIDRPPGRYRMAVVRDGVAVPGTERSLRVVTAAGGPDIVANVFPEERWTRPLTSNSARSRIYARPGSTFYITLAEASRSMRPTTCRWSRRRRRPSRGAKYGCGADRQASGPSSVTARPSPSTGSRSSRPRGRASATRSGVPAPGKQPTSRPSPSWCRPQTMPPGSNWPRRRLPSTARLFRSAHARLFLVWALALIPAVFAGALAARRRRGEVTAR